VRLVFLSVVLVLALLAALVFWSGKPSVRANRAPLPMTFAHADHEAVTCVRCHHNFVDDVGFGGECLHCHQTDAAVAHLVEEQFHGLCRGCHLEQHATGEPGGPVRQCQACHTADEHP
jgi:hypothetical protein